MPLIPGTLRTDNEGVVYLNESPASTMLHSAYQEYDIDSIGTTYTKLFSTDERHIVNGINNLYGTSYNWGDLRGNEVEFFTPTAVSPITRLKFEKVGIYYVAEVIVDKSLDLDSLGELVNIDSMTTRASFPLKDVLYYSSKDNKNALRQFAQATFSTDELSFNPSRDIDFTLMHLGEDTFLTPVVIRNYSNHDGYSTLLFKNEVLPAVELKMLTYSKNNVLRSLGAVVGVTLTTDNYIAPNVVRVFEPFQNIDETYTIHTLRRGTEIRYFATTPTESDEGDIIIGEPPTRPTHMGFRTAFNEPLTHSIQVGGQTLNTENQPLNYSMFSYIIDDYSYLIQVQPGYGQDGEDIFVVSITTGYGNAPLEPVLVTLVPPAESGIVIEAISTPTRQLSNNTVSLDTVNNTLTGYIVPTLNIS